MGTRNKIKRFHCFYKERQKRMSEQQLYRPLKWQENILENCQYWMAPTPDFYDFQIVKTEDQYILSQVYDGDGDGDMGGSIYIDRFDSLNEAMAVANCDWKRNVKRIESEHEQFVSFVQKMKRMMKNGSI